jgi:hypothetical protein
MPMDKKQTENQNQNEQKIERAERVLKMKVKTNVRGGSRGIIISDKEWME